MTKTKYSVKEKIKKYAHSARNYAIGLIAAGAIATNVAHADTNTVNSAPASFPAIYYGVGLNASGDSSVSGEIGYKNPEWGAAVFGESGVAGVKAGLFDMGSYKLDGSGAIYLGKTTGASVTLGKDFIFGKDKNWNLRPEVGAGYFKAGDESTFAGAGSVAIQRQVGNWTFSAGINGYTDKDITGSSVGGLFTISYGAGLGNSMTHFSGVGGLEDRLSDSGSTASTSSTSSGSTSSTTSGSTSTTSTTTSGSTSSSSSGSTSSSSSGSTSSTSSTASTSSTSSTSSSSSGSTSSSSSGSTSSSSSGSTSTTSTTTSGSTSSSSSGSTSSSSSGSTSSTSGPSGGDGDGGPVGN
jgi:hypothetical protein